MDKLILDNLSIVSQVNCMSSLSVCLFHTRNILHALGVFYIQLKSGETIIALDLLVIILNTNGTYTTTKGLSYYQLFNFV